MALCIVPTVGLDQYSGTITYHNLPGIDMDELMGLYHSGQTRDFIITQLEFHKSEIRGIIALLEDMGISTTTY